MAPSWSRRNTSPASGSWRPPISTWRSSSQPRGRRRATGRSRCGHSTASEPTAVQGGVGIGPTRSLEGCEAARGAACQVRRQIEMTQYIILFDDGDMVFPVEDLPDVASAAQAVVKQA